ncbi:hypothetical protein TrRE_jg7343 [Triparma retinervis]|uniref:TRM5/TYW2-like methyltransferase domain-containing protein n=1 Tax=Triparma retinervis TaxID=2557542 RepID=A0A9W6Z7E6_9STRA|nr:hypothetical protein TrRE_jg7343 [Triparma retinervis]
MVGWTRGVVVSSEAADDVYKEMSRDIPKATSAFIGEKSVMKSTREGIFLVNKEDTYVGRSLDLYGEWCVSEVAMFRRIVKEGDVVLDVGANIGAFTVPLAKMAGPRGAVVAFEPQRQVFQLLNANIALNELTNCWAYHKGVGGQGGSVITPKVNYSVPGNFGGISLLEEERWGERGPVEVVEVVRLDDVRKVLNIHTYYNPDNFFGYKKDVFSDGLLSMNLVCVPRATRGDLIEQFEAKGMVKVDVQGGKYYLDDYILNWRGRNIVEPLRDVIGRERVEKILLVGKDEEGDAGKLVLLEKLTKLDTGLLHAAAVGGVDHVNKGVSLVEVVPPVGSDGLLSCKEGRSEGGGMERERKERPRCQSNPIGAWATRDYEIAGYATP